MSVSDTVHNLQVVTLSVTGPVSYATGGFLVDPTADISWLGFMAVGFTAGTLPGHEFEIVCNQDLSGAEAFGKGVVKIVKHQNSQASVGNVSGNPGGTTVQSALTANTASTHTHTLNHDHGSVTSGAMSPGGAGSNAGTSPDALNHTHVFTIPALTATSAAGGSHAHDRAFQYSHTHPVTSAASDISIAEVANGTNLSTVTFKVICFGFGEQ